MPFNGSGTYSLPAGNPVVNNTVADSTVHNNTNSDIATALSNTLTKDGQSTPTADIPMGGYELTGVGDGSALQSGATVKQLQNNGAITLSSVSGTDTITATAAPVPSAYAAGQIFVFEPAATNTGAATINISSLGAKSIFYNGAAVAAGALPSGKPVAIRYDGTQFEIIAKTDYADLGSGVWDAPNGLTVNTDEIILDSAGNVGLGAAPVATGYSGTNTTCYIENTSAAALSLDSSSTGKNYSIISDSAGSLSFYDEDVNLIRAKLINTGYFAFSPDGSFLNGNYFEVSQPDTNPLNRAIVCWHKATTGDNNLIEFYTDGGPSGRGSIDFNRSGGVVRYNTSSDATLKNIIGDADLNESFDLVMGCRLRSYSWLNDETNKLQIGVIAQEEYEHFKGSVSVGGYDENGDYRAWAVDKTAYVWHLVGTCQKQQQEIETLQSVIKDITKRIEKLENNHKG